MAIKSNGDSSTGPKILTGSYTFDTATYTYTWDANSINYTLGGVAGTFNWIDVSFEAYGAQLNGFKSTPIITATIRGASGYALVPRVASGGAYYASNQGFRFALYNTSGSVYTLGSNIIVNWIAIENTNKAL